MNLPGTPISSNFSDPASKAVAAPQAPARVASTSPAGGARASTAAPDAVTVGANRDELDKELAAANAKLASDGREIRFEYDRDASKVIVRLVDTSTQEVLRQFPSNEALRMARLANSGKPLLNILA